MAGISRPEVPGVFEFRKSLYLLVMKELRARNLRQMEIAELLGCSQALVSQMKRGHVPRVDLVLEMSFILGIPVVVGHTPQADKKRGNIALSAYLAEDLRRQKREMLQLQRQMAATQRRQKALNPELIE